jgi:uncharacterized protein YceH (UPF0502 family)
MSLDLSPVETRILGCLLEKERTTPEAYPLTLNSLTAAANQTTNRDPVMSLDSKDVELALDELRAKKLAAMIMMAGSRVQKYRHQLPDHYDLSPAETAILCVLMLRGAQTVGELKTRTDRIYGFADTVELEKCLSDLAEGSDPLVRQLPPQPGQKGVRWVQLISGEPDPEILMPRSAPVTVVPGGHSRVDKLEEEVLALRKELAALREEFTEFRRQFEG